MICIRIFDYESTQLAQLRKLLIRKKPSSFTLTFWNQSPLLIETIILCMCYNFRKRLILRTFNIKNLVSSFTADIRWIPSPFLIGLTTLVFLLPYNQISATSAATNVHNQSRSDTLDSSIFFKYP